MALTLQLFFNFVLNSTNFVSFKSHPVEIKAWHFDGGIDFRDRFGER